MSRTKVIPVNSQIVVKVPKTEEGERRVGSLIIPESVTTEKPHQGVVHLSDHKDYSVGDVVLYRKYSGFEFKIDGEEYLVIEAGDVLVKLQEILDDEV